MLRSLITRSNLGLFAPGRGAASGSLHSTRGRPSADGRPLVLRGHHRAGLEVAEISSSKSTTLEEGITDARMRAREGDAQGNEEAGSVLQARRNVSRRRQHAPPGEKTRVGSVLKEQT